MWIRIQIRIRIRNIGAKSVRIRIHNTGSSYPINIPALSFACIQVEGANFTLSQYQWAMYCVY